MGALACVERAGHCLVPGALPPATVAALAAEVHCARFSPLPEVIGPVQQRGLQLLGEPGDPTLTVATALAAEVSLAARTSGIPRFRPFEVDEIAYQRYLAPDGGISGHRDSLRYRCLIAVFTLDGEASFEILAGRSGPALSVYQPGPGDLILLRAPAIDGPDDRMMHSVGPPLGDRRLSVTLRMRDLHRPRPLPLAPGQTPPRGSSRPRG